MPSFFSLVFPPSSIPPNPPRPNILPHPPFHPTPRIICLPKFEIPLSTWTPHKPREHLTFIFFSKTQRLEWFWDSSLKLAVVPELLDMSLQVRIAWVRRRGIFRVKCE
jgi:hypothetical protein